MYANRYTLERAESLVPILRSIAREIGERTRAIERLESVHEASASVKARGLAPKALGGLGADLANQRRELRFAKQELGRYGCTLDEDRPLRILIPGEDGTFVNGFAWDPTDERLSAVRTPRRSDPQSMPVH